MLKQTESVVQAICIALRSEEPVIASWEYSSNWLFVNNKRLAGEYRIVSPAGVVVEANEFIEIIS